MSILIDNLIIRRKNLIRNLNSNSDQWGSKIFGIERRKLRIHSFRTRSRIKFQIFKAYSLLLYEEDNDPKKSDLFFTFNQSQIMKEFKTNLWLILLTTLKLLSIDDQIQLKRFHYLISISSSILRLRRHF